MNILVIGLNHRTADVSVREKLAFSEHKALECLNRVKDLKLVDEALVLSTCNRVEFYHVDRRDDTYESLVNYLGSFHNLALAEFEDSLYFHRNREAVRHLFRVCSGLDSMVAGETEVLGQVKKAYQLAVSASSTGPMLNTLFQRAFNVAKMLRVHTRFYEGSLSVSSIAVQLADKIFGDLSSKIVLLIGAGKMSEQTVERLMKKGVRGIIASNRSYDKAVDLAARFQGEAVRLDELQSICSKVDIIISSTAAPHVLLRYEDVQAMMHERRQRPLFIIDIAVPRDVEPQVNRLDNVYLYNIDDLRSIADRNLQQKVREKGRAEELVDQETDRFMRRCGDEGLGATIQKLHHKLENIRAAEVLKTKAALKDLNETEWNEIEYLTQRLVRNILHGPLVRLKENGGDPREMDLSRALAHLFELEDPEQ